MEKIRLLAFESIYYINMNSDIEDSVKIALHVLNSRQHSSRTKHYHMKYQGGHGNLLGLTSLPPIKSTTLAL